MTAEKEQTTERVYSLHEVEKQEQMLAKTRERVTALHADVQRFTAEIADVLADGGDATALQAERTEKRQLCEDLAASAEVLQLRVRERREAACYEEARTRRIGINRAFGSVRDQLGQDLKRLAKAAEEYLARLAKLNDRYAQSIVLRVEDQELARRFPGAGVSNLPGLIRPAALGDALGTMRIVREAMLSDATLPTRDRRRRGLIKDTPGGRIIEAGGGFERPDVALSPDELPARPAEEEKQRDILAAREVLAERKRKDTERFWPEIGVKRPVPGGAPRG